MATLAHLNIPNGCQRLWLGVSGGIDSMVLLHWAAQAIKALPNQSVALHVIHVNHQLNKHSGQWQQAVHNACEHLGLPFVVKVVTVQGKKGEEEAARNARYSAFESVLMPSDVLALAHHQDDQAETFLFRLMRGAGVKGLGAMPATRKLANGTIWRPFLNVPKAAITAYAKHHTLQWCEDDSNSDTRYDRNYLRANILPQLAARWPQAAKKITQAAIHATQAQTLLDEYATADLHTLHITREKHGYSLCLNALARLSGLRQNQALRLWLRQLGCLALDAKHFDALREVIEARQDAAPALWLATDAKGHIGFKRFGARLYFLPYRLTPPKGEKRLTEQTTILDDGSHLTINGLPKNATITLRFRDAVKRAQPIGRPHSQTLKRLLQEYAVPPWLRSQVPMIFYNEQLIAVGDYWQESTCPAGVTVVWSYPK